jgi:putative molybdopterin biosynthesis protein
VEEDYFLVCLADALEQPAVRLLCSLLQSPDWHRAVTELDGYACPPMAGEVLSLTRALPWWTFRAPKATEPPSDRHADAP